MVRLIFPLTTVLLGIAVPLTPGARESKPSSPQVEIVLAREALEVSSMVRIRFYMSGISTMCGRPSPRIAYDLLLSHFSARGREIIESAAEEGFRDAVATVQAAGGRVDCDEAARNLAATERTLRTRAEILRPPS